MYENTHELKAYSDFRPGDMWGQAEWNGKRINLYTDVGFMAHLFEFDMLVSLNISSRKDSYKGNIADFGGADGAVTFGLKEILDNRWPGNMERFYVIDKNPSALELFDKRKTVLMQSVHMDLLGLKGSRYADFFNYGTMRFVLNYIRREDHSLLFENVFSSMKEGSMVTVFHCSSLDGRTAEIYSGLLGEINKAIGRDPKEYYYGPMEEIVQAAGKIGFKHHSMDQIDIESYYSAKSYGSRFSIEESKMKDVERIFEKWKDRFPPEYCNDTKGIRSAYTRCTLIKN